MASIAYETKVANRRPIDWRVDDDGFLRITFCALKSGIYPYLKSDVPAKAREVLGDKEIYMEYIDLDECTPEELSTLEGKPINAKDHTWRTAHNTLKDRNTAGAVAGAPYKKGDEILCDAVIYDRDVAQDIMDGKLVEVSAAYDSLLEARPGIYNNRAYDLRQKGFKFNHVLLLPAGEGRCGDNARIINNKHGEKQTMPEDRKVTFRVQIGNASHTFGFTTEQDREAAEQIMRAVEQDRTEALQRVKNEFDALSKELANEKERADGLEEECEKVKVELENACSEEKIEAVVKERNAQVEDETEIVNSFGLAASEADKLLASLRVGNMAERRRNFAAEVLKRNGMVMPEGWDSNLADASFYTAAATARAYNKRVPANALPHARMNSVNGGAMSARERMLAPMRIKQEVNS